MFEQPDVLPIIYGGKKDVFYKLQEDYRVHVHVERMGHMITILVPKGFVTDLASIPRWVWTITGCTPDGLYRAAAVVHDYIYGLHLKGFNYSRVPRPDGGWNILYREDCDRIFRELIEDSKDDNWKTKAFFWAVRTFGGFYY